MSDYHNNHYNVGWFLAGLGLGVGAAILYAPTSGRETRKAALAGVDDGREQMASLGRDAREHINSWVDSGRDAIKRRREPGQPAVEKKHEAVHDAATNAGSGINE